MAELFIKTQKVLVDLVVEEMEEDNHLLLQVLLDVLTPEAVVAENGLVHLDTLVDLVSLS